MDDRIGCLVNGVKLNTVLSAVSRGMTAQQIISETGACGACPRCRALMAAEPVCACLGVNTADIAKAMQNDADTLEEVLAATGAGAVCGRCRERVKEIFAILC